MGSHRLTFATGPIPLRRAARRCMGTWRDAGGRLPSSIDAPSPPAAPRQLRRVCKQAWTPPSPRSPPGALRSPPPALDPGARKAAACRGSRTLARHRSLGRRRRRLPPPGFACRPSAAAARCSAIRAPRSSRRRQPSRGREHARQQPALSSRRRSRRSSRRLARRLALRGERQQRRRPWGTCA